MGFRLKAGGIHLAVSVVALLLILVPLYVGWYRWPGWYLTGVMHVVVVMVGVDAALGPSLTLLIASPRKPRPELVRDIGVIVSVQLVALLYGAITLWQGRPLYYTFSVDRLEIVQASALAPNEVDRARTDNPSLAPYWHSRPRWVWAPLPDDEDERNRIVTSAVVTGEDVIDMPRYFRPWAEGLPALRQTLRQIDDVPIFSAAERTRLKMQLTQLGLPVTGPIASFMMGRETRLLVTFDPATMAIRAMLPPPTAGKR